MANAKKKSFRKAKGVSLSDRMKIKKSDKCVHELCNSYNLPVEVIVAFRTGEKVPAGC